ncbi:hypothetical protein [Paenibacillus sp. Marseille-Q4541]|uniref:hypothetical protein n=1 Tax=Paenibacillus sp. Marseille-Q4541 TaxID=2831522 RepID=UPI001BA85668|nr:hypothetical protein [Paenibacillus sp. Marseille-Q4541]
MALGLLVIMFTIIAIISIVSIGLLFTVKNRKINNIIFAVTVIIGIVVSYMNFTALPTNYTTEQIVAVIFGLLAVIALILKFMNKDRVAKILSAASVVLGVVQLFFF